MVCFNCGSAICCDYPPGWCRGRVETNTLNRQPDGTPRLVWLLAHSEGSTHSTSTANPSSEDPPQGEVRRRHEESCFSAAHLYKVVCPMKIAFHHVA